MLARPYRVTPRHIRAPPPLLPLPQLVVDAKADYPAACNAVEKVLLHSAWLPMGGLEAIRAALEGAGVEVHAGRWCA